QTLRNTITLRNSTAVAHHPHPSAVLTTASNPYVVQPPRHTPSRHHRLYYFLVFERDSKFCFVKMFDRSCCLTPLQRIRDQQQSIDPNQRAIKKTASQPLESFSLLGSSPLSSVEDQLSDLMIQTDHQAGPSSIACTCSQSWKMRIITQIHLQVLKIVHFGPQ
ncbi:hypothetical protein LINPERHAP1_LOCUS8373, partial [Linum perenne]